MKKPTMSLAFAASVLALAAIQANGTNTSPPRLITDHGARACRALVQKMEKTPSANTWRNRMRTWKCRDEFVVGAIEVEAPRELGQ